MAVVAALFRQIVAGRRDKLVGEAASRVSGWLAAGDKLPPYRPQAFGPSRWTLSRAGEGYGRS